MKAIALAIVSCLLCSQLILTVAASYAALENLPNALPRETLEKMLLDAEQGDARNSTTPLDVRLAATTDPTEMVVGWRTIKTTQNSVVRYGTQRGMYTYEIRQLGPRSTYHEAAGYVHFVKLHQLQPRTRYYYVCGDDSSHGGFSPEFSFVTLPANGRNASEIKFVAYGDMGVTRNKHTLERVRNRVKEGRVDFVYHVGDISYADDYSFVSAALYDIIYNEWFSQVEPITANVPYMTCPGNHEHACRNAHCMSYTDNFTAYNARFRMPAATEKSGNMWFSWDYGFIHFVSISTETDYPHQPYASEFGDQLAWLDRDLASAVARPEPPKWIVVVGHRPFYTSHNRGSDIRQMVHLQAAFGPIFDKYHVDLYINGHVHAYERTHPVNNGVVTTTKDGTVYITAGAAGCLEGVYKKDWIEPAPKWAAHRFFRDEGYGIVTANATALRWQYFRSSDDGLEDEVVLAK